MAKSFGQKLKILYILKILMEETDEKHAITTQQLIQRLESYDISAERKSIYDDIRNLQDFGYDILQKENRNGAGYCLLTKDFEVAELKLLVDAVQSSRFITEKKSRELIGKLEHLASRHEAQQLQRQVYVAGRVKTENEAIYYQIDALNRAIQENVQIRFSYMEWNKKKELVPKKNEPYQVSPWILMWKDENYYLVAYDETDACLKHYRMDKIMDVELTDIPRAGKKHYERRNPAEYVNKTFGMFGAEEEDIILTFPESLVGVIIDRFGKEVSIRPQGELQRARVKVMASNQFFGWVAGVGSKLQIAEPAHVREKYKNWLKGLLEEME